MSQSPNGLINHPNPMNLPPMSGPGGGFPPGPPGMGPPGQKNQMSDYINAALRSIEQSIETRDPSQPPMMLPPHFNPGPPFNPPPPGHMPPHQMGHFGQFDPAYAEMQFDETNPHHPAFHPDQHGGQPGHVVPPPMFNPSFEQLSNEGPSFAPPSPPPVTNSGNELRPSDQTGPYVEHSVSGHGPSQLQFNYDLPTSSVQQQQQHQQQQQQHQSHQTNQPINSQPYIPAQTQVVNSQVGSQVTTSENLTSNKKQQKFNASPDSGSRCSISPRDSGYDT